MPENLYVPRMIRVRSPTRPFRRSGVVLFALLFTALCAPGAAAAAGSISGTVTDAANDSPLQGVEVCASALPGESDAGCTETDADGKYGIEIPDGNYYVLFDGRPINYEKQWLGEPEHGYLERTVVNVGSGEISGIDAALVHFGWIKGTVSEQGSGLPVGGVRVCAWHVDYDSYSECTFSDSDGQYEVANLHPGSYTVEFWPRHSNHLWQYYDHKAHSSEAIPVTVPVGTVVPGIDADVPPAAGLEGVVRQLGTGDPYFDAWVWVRPAVKDDTWGFNSWITIPVGEDGSWSIIGMPPGDYKVEFDPKTPGWETQFWDHGTSWEEATTLALAPGTITTGIDADLQGPQSTSKPDPSSHLESTPPAYGPLSLLLPAPNPRRCRKGLRMKRVESRLRCVRKHKKHRHRAQR